MTSLAERPTKARSRSRNTTRTTKITFPVVVMETTFSTSTSKRKIGDSATEPAGLATTTTRTIGDVSVTMKKTITRTTSPQIPGLWIGSRTWLLVGSTRGRARRIGISRRRARHQRRKS